MEVHIRGLDRQTVRWLVNILGRGAYEFRQQGEATLAMNVGSVLGAILTDTASLGEAVSERIEAQRTANADAVPDRIVVDLASLPANVVRLNFG